MAVPDKAKMVEIKTANRIKNLKGTGSSASAKASKADLESKGGVYTSKDVTKGMKAVEARRKIDLGKTLARAKAKTIFKEEAKAKAKPKPAAVKKAAPKPKVEKRAPMETTRIGGIISVPKRPKKTVY
jgi:hypothetical protein